MGIKQKLSQSTPTSNSASTSNVGNTTVSLLDKDREREKKRRAAESSNIGKEFQTIDFNSLDISILRKYARAHKIKTKPNMSKEELAASVSRHFANQTVKETDTITCFLYTAHYKDSVLRLPLHI